MIFLTNFRLCLRLKATYQVLLFEDGLELL